MASIQMSREQLLSRFPCHYHVNIIINIKKTIVISGHPEIKKNLIASNRNYQFTREISYGNIGI